MGTARHTGRAKAFSLLELLCVMFLIALLAALLLPALSQARARARRISCVNHLREIGIAFHSFAHDHDGRFPMALPTSSGGALEFVQSGYRINQAFYFAFRQFQALSNELVTTRLLVCRADTRSPAADFQRLQNDNLSYFVGVTAEYLRPNSLLAGDRNLTNDFVSRSGVLSLRPSSPLRWTRELHEFKGNLLFADGRVVEKNSPALMLAQDSSPATESLFLPAIPSPRSKAEPATVATGSAPQATVTGSPSAGTASSATNAGPAGQFMPLANPAAGLLFSLASRTASGPDSTTPAPTPPQQPQSKTGSSGVPPSSSTLTRKLPDVDPGFSLFPIWLSAPFRGLVKNDAWLLLLFLSLAVVGVLVLRKRLQSRPGASRAARGRIGGRVRSRF